MSKWQAWYDAQPEHIQHWMDQPRPLWYDSDMWRAGMAGAVIGFIIGVIV